MHAFDIPKLELAGSEAVYAAGVLKCELKSPAGPQLQALKLVAKWLRAAASDVDSAIQN